MPVHDAMYTSSLAERIKDLLPEGHKLIKDAEVVEDYALESSSLGATASVFMFELLKDVMKDSNLAPSVRETASKIYHGSYNSEVA